jgi:DNA-binding GntR family transcriptional regulator
VREALRELEEQGVVVSYPHRGSFVRSFSAKDVDNLVYLRAAVEGMAAFQAVEYASRAHMRRLRQVVDAMGVGDPVGDVEGPPHPQIMDLEFHEMLVDLSGNDELARVWRRVDPLLRTLQAHHLRSPEEDIAAYHRRLVERHAVIVDALLSGDAAAAEHAARDHVIDAGLRVTADMRRLELSRSPEAPVRDLASYRSRRGAGRHGALPAPGE